MNQWERPDPPLNSLVWFCITQQAYFLGLDIRDYSKQWGDQKKDRDKLKKLDSTLGSENVACSPTTMVKLTIHKTEGNCVCHGLEHAHSEPKMMGVKWKTKAPQVFSPLPPKHFHYRRESRYFPSRYHSWEAFKSYRKLQNEQLLTSFWGKEENPKLW